MPVQDLPFVGNMEKRIQNASRLLDASLAHCFVDGLEHQDANAIYNCLRAYAAIDNTTSAEEIFRTTVVAPMIQKIIPYGQSGMAAPGDALESDYQSIKQSIREDCKFLLNIASTGSLPLVFYCLFFSYLIFCLKIVFFLAGPIVSLVLLGLLLSDLLSDNSLFSCWTHCLLGFPLGTKPYILSLWLLHLIVLLDHSD